MAYADRNQSGSRVVAIVVVSVLVFAMGYAFVTGLTYNYVKKMQEKLKAFDVQEPPPPPPDEPPPHRRQTSRCRRHPWCRRRRS
jgi:protein TonB